MEEVKKRPKMAKKVALWVVGAILIWAVLTFIVILLLPRHNQSDQLREQLQSIKTNFPLYYTKELPDTVELSPGSFNEHEEVVIYTLTQGANQISVSQQARPRLMEEVNKVKDIASPLGKAYVAKLEKHTVGFLVTDKTLVIISSVENLDDATIETLLKNLVAL